MSDSKISIAVAGCGYWGKNLVRNFFELGSLKAVFDTNPEKAQSFAEKYNVEAKSWEEILKDDTIDGIAIVAPAPLHGKLASEAMKAGKGVFVEKPLALTAEDASKLIEESRSTNTILMVGHLLQYHNAFIKVKEMVKQGTIGNLRRIYSNRLSFGKVRTEENVLWSFAPHDISMILALTGQEPSDINAFGSSHLSEGIQDYAHVHLDFANDITAHIFVSWLNPFKEQKLVVVGDQGMLVFDDTLPPEQKIALYKHQVSIDAEIPSLSKADAEFIEFDIKEPLKEECRYFVNCIANKSTPITDGEEGLRVLKVLESAQTSMDLSQQDKVA
jgi:predicted dehydrogenase